MSDKQLTVAELLAKAGKDGGSRRGRRRRRSLEEGGISVAELTGNIPRVTAKPAESKHSSQPIDAEPITLGGDKDIVLSIVDENEPVRLTTDSFPAITPEVIAAHQAEKEKKAQEEATQSEEHSEGEAAPAPSQASESLGGSDAETTVLREVVDEGDEEEAPAAPSKPAKSRFAPLKPKGGLGAIGADAVEEDLTENDAAAEDAFVVDAETEEAYAEDEVDAESYEDEGAYADDEVEATTNFAAVDEDAQVTTNFAAVEEEDLDLSEDEVPAEDGAYVDDAIAYDEDVAEEELAAGEVVEEEESMSILAVIGMAVAGIILGIAIFIGFETLWGALPRPAVAALGLVVTGILVGIVHMMRPARDVFSKVLAGVAGLIMTFGPMLIAGL